MTLLLGIIFGAIGGIYLLLGRREHEPLLLAIGIALVACRPGSGDGSEESGRLGRSRRASRPTATGDRPRRAAPR